MYKSQPYSLIIWLLLWGCIASAAPDYAAQRAELLEEISRDTRQTSIYTDKRALAPRILRTLGEVPRHLFVPPRYRKQAYENRPLSIGYGQTISQPFIVALMTELLAPEADDVVLEIGTGSAYQAAVLSRLVRRVYSIEIVPELGKQAAERLADLGYDNVETRVGDGYYGWKEHAPFDAIIVTAAAGHVPPPLIRQLKPGGRMVIPVGSPFMTQQLMLVEKDADGTVRNRQLLPVAFVPLTGEH